MGFLPILVYVGYVAFFISVAFSLGSGLYYLAEIVEEYSVQTKRIIRASIGVIIGFHVLLLAFDRLSWWKLVFSIGCHAWYSLMLRTFPSIPIVDPVFIISCVLAVADHFLWFWHFSSQYHPFAEVATFFGLCVWLVPFMFFVSLTANEYTLPNFDSSNISASGPQKKKTNIVKSLFGNFAQGSSQGLGESRKLY
ncbi:transmembrane adaptor Erv26 [Polychytrium aggregatum]|uniref:transmembrane adaptor Erv26 n=1 Tax=Polychytrium aggregatum TaxID=110093 RepID=UPI0022FF1FF1|nr:transmembrane adaptor Erv26 [Polychytrium aggregatum]KAI9208751.1 transmembrane adaptor Erv26 [Polychytrium aggregatum]